MVWNLPNILTILRVILIPIFVGLAYLPPPWGQTLSALTFALAALTDWADGYLARLHHQVTPFGRYFDPVADKLLVISALVLLVANQRALVVPVLIIIAREITIMALREYMAGQGMGVPVSAGGKWKTGFQMMAIVMLLVQDGLGSFSFRLPGLVCLYIAVLLTLWSGAGYLLKAWPMIQGSE